MVVVVEVEREREEREFFFRWLDELDHVQW